MKNQIGAMYALCYDGSLRTTCIIIESHNGPELTLASEMINLFHDLVYFDGLVASRGVVLFRGRARLPACLLRSSRASHELKAHVCRSPNVADVTQ